MFSAQHVLLLSCFLKINKGEKVGKELETFPETTGQDSWNHRQHCPLGNLQNVCALLPPSHRDISTLNPHWKNLLKSQSKRH